MNTEVPADDPKCGLSGGDYPPRLSSHAEEEEELATSLGEAEEEEKNRPPLLFDAGDSEAASSVMNKTILIKQEEDADCDYGGGGDGVVEYYLNGEGRNCTSSSSSSSGFPKPMEGLHDSAPPPFLKKTFEMVEDLETDPIVSWSKNRDSFVVWDSHEFSKFLLPKYFKHSNFSSFIRQLNTYGFRKIDPDRWEFANEGFQGGKKHLLKNIKRRNRYSNNNKHHHHHHHYHKQKQLSIHCSDLTLGTELDSLRNDHELLKLEIMKLRQTHQDSETQLVAVEERVRAAECKQLQMFMFFVKATRNPAFIQRRLSQRRKLDCCGGMVKKRRLLPTAEIAAPDHHPVDNNIINCRNQARRHLATMQSELAQVLPKDSSDPAAGSDSKLFCSPIHEQQEEKVDNVGSDEDIVSVYDDLMSTEDLLEEENPVDEDLDMNESRLFSELENLLGSSSSSRAHTWTGCVTGLVSNAG
ncbi:Heat shock factor protein HSF30 [Linum grandiflorum]